MRGAGVASLQEVLLHGVRVREGTVGIDHVEPRPVQALQDECEFNVKIAGGRVLPLYPPPPLFIGSYRRANCWPVSCYIKTKQGAGKPYHVEPYPVQALQDECEFNVECCSTTNSNLVLHASQSDKPCRGGGLPSAMPFTVLRFQAHRGVPR